MDAELLPPFTAAVREQYYKGEYGSEKAKARRRNVPLSVWLVTALVELKKRDFSLSFRASSIRSVPASMSPSPTAPHGAHWSASSTTVIPY